MPPHSYRELPFLYFPTQPEDQTQPETLLLMNHLAETAAVHHPGQVAFSKLQAVRQRYKLSLGSFLADLHSLKECCQILLDRSRIYEHYQNCYETCGDNSFASFSVSK
jgi:hypothetical protein